MDGKNLTTMETNTPINGQGDGSEQRARDMAARYRCEFVDLRDYHLDAELFKTVPVDLMFRYNFVPLEQNDGTLSIAMADPSKLMMIDELALLLNRRIKIKVATLVADQRHSEEDGAVAARAGRGHRRLCAGRGARRRCTAMRTSTIDKHHRHGGSRRQPRSSAGRYHDFQRAGKARQRYSH